MALRIFRPIALAVQHRALLAQLVRRELSNKYQGTLLGGFWSLLNPLLMLALYTFVFKVIFNARWPDMNNSNADFASVLFVGLLVHGFLAEVLTRSTAVIVDNTNYVKKIVFPLPILAWNLVISALSNMLLGFVVLLLFMLVTQKPLHVTLLLVPFVCVPLLLIALGVSWVLSSVAVFFRDLAQIIPVFSTLLLFSSTAFFPLESAPPLIRPILLFNPLTIMIDSLRDIIIYGRLPNLEFLLIYSLIACLIFYVGYHLFCRLARGFSDVL